jgi:hypothetical protein
MQYAQVAYLSLPKSGYSGLLQAVSMPTLLVSSDVDMHRIGTPPFLALFIVFRE